MPLTEKGKKIKSSMESQYGKEKGEQVFYASKNKGTIKGVEGHGGMKRNRHGATKYEKPAWMRNR